MSCMRYAVGGLLAVLIVASFVSQAEAQRAVNPVVRTFRPDPNWGGYGETNRSAGELVMVDQTIADPAAFIRANRCLVGRWVFDRKLQEAYFGHLTEVNANYDDQGVRRSAGPFRVVIPADRDIELALQPAQRADVVILREIPGTTMHELVAYNGVPEEGTVYLPREIANTGDAYWGSRELMYQQ